MRKLRQNELLTREQVVKLQSDSLQGLRKTAYAFSPFYQKFHRGHFDHPLSELPVLTKSMLMENFNDLVTDPAIRLEEIRDYISRNQARKRYLGKYEVSATSGTTGEPGLFIFNASEWGMAIASLERAQRWSGVKINFLRRPKTVSVASLSPWHLSSKYIESIHSFLTPALSIPANKPMAEIVRELNRWHPYFLSVYPATARALAAEKEAGRLKINPRGIYTGAEILTRETRRIIRDAWGNDPYDFYGSTEAAGIAAQYDTCRRMHLFEDLLILENVDEKNQPVGEGEFGAKLLVTNLFNFTQPLIRYEISDSVRLSTGACGKCSLPFGVLEGIQGRLEDVLFVPGLSKSRVAIQPGVFDRVMDILPVTGWQVIQERDDFIRVVISGVQDSQTGAGEKLNIEELAESLKKDLLSEGAKVDLEVQVVDYIARPPSGKVPLVQSLKNSM